MSNSSTVWQPAAWKQPFCPHSGNSASASPPTAFSPAGLLTGSVPTGKSDFRRFLPRYAPSNLASNQTIIAQLQAVAAEHNATLVQVALAWVLSRSQHIVPVLGSRTVTQWNDAVRALILHLTPEDHARTEQAIPVGSIQGTRYDKVAMTHLDSER